MGVWYRLSQFWQNVTARPLNEAQTAVIRHYLTDAEYGLYQQYAPEDQQHTFRVFELVREAGGNDLLLKAALLHDVGKARVTLSVWARAVVVLAKRLWPQRLSRWGAGEARGWKRPFVVRAQHPAWGAEMAAAAGSEALVLWLIDHHQDLLADEDTTATERETLLRLLQWADDQC